MDYTLSLHDALPIFVAIALHFVSSSSTVVVIPHNVSLRVADGMRGKGCASHLQIVKRAKVLA